MKRYAIALTIVAATASAPAFAQTKAKATGVPEISYDSVPNFLKLPPNLYMGEAMGVATNSKGHLFVFTRSANTRLFEFAHSVRVDPQDNVWAVDEGTNMVIKFNPAGKVVMVIGHRPEMVDGLTATSNAPPPPAAK